MKIARTARAFLMGVGCCALLASQSYAQSRGSTTSSLFGASQVGNPAGASASGTGSGFTTGQGSTNGNASVPGANAGAGGTANSLGLGANMQDFNPGGTTGFVGASANSAQNLMSRVGTQGAVQAGRVNFGTLGNLMNQSRQNQFNRQQAQRNTRSNTQSKSRFRVPLRVGFQPPLPPAGTVGPRLSTQISKVPGITQLGPISVSLVGQTAVLQGTVASDADRQLAADLARLEPGVLAVQNELEVAPAQLPVEALPPAVP